MCYTLIVILTVILMGHSKIIQYKNCSTCNALLCTIHQLDIEPCESSESETTICIMRKSSNLTMHMSYTPMYRDDSPPFYTYVEVVKGFKLEILDPNACLYTQCPIEQGQKNNYTIGLPIPDENSIGEAKIKATMKNGIFDCCIEFSIKIIDK